MQFDHSSSYPTRAYLGYLRIAWQHVVHFGHHSAEDEDTFDLEPSCDQEQRTRKNKPHTPLWTAMHEPVEHVIGEECECTSETIDEIPQRNL